jgi:hypothetical protein
MLRKGCSERRTFSGSDVVSLTLASPLFTIQDDASAASRRTRYSCRGSCGKAQALESGRYTLMGRLNPYPGF